MPLREFSSVQVGDQLPEKVYPLYGFHYIVQDQITRATNVQFYMDLFGVSDDGLVTKSRGVGTILNDD